MSLSKHLSGFPPTTQGLTAVSDSVSGSQQWNVQKLGIWIGVPVALCTAVGVFYWYSCRRQSKGAPAPSKKIDKKKDVPLPEIKSKATKPEKPKYMMTKDVGNELFRKADYAGALEAYAQAIKEGPPQDELAKLYQNRAAVFEKLGDWVQLIVETTAAIQIDPKYVKARHRRAKAYKKTGFLDEALEDCTAACMLESFQFQSTIIMADEILKEIGANEAAKLMSTQSPSAPSDHAVASFLRSFYFDPVTLWWQDRESELLNKFKSQVDDIPQRDDGGDSDTTDQHNKGFIAAIQALKDKKYENILEFCDDELKNPDSKHRDETYLLRGTFRFLWGYGDEVVSDLQQVADSEKAEPILKSSAYIKMGLRYAIVNDHAKCAECFQKAEQVSPENVDIYHHCGQCLLTLGEFDNAATMIDKAYQICPDFAIAAASKWYAEYRCAARTQDESGILFAMRNFNKCLRKFPDIPDISSLYGQMLMEQGRHKEASEQFENVIRIDPGNAAVFVHKAMAQYQMHQNMEQSVQDLLEATKVDDKCEFLYETLGTLQLQTGDLKGAIESITKALNLARTQQEIVMLCSLKRAAEVQSKMKDTFDFPAFTAKP